MSSRKRRRSQAFQEEEIQVDVVEDVDSDASQSLDEDKDQAEKEREVWDAVREERYEIVEQLPLTIHRQLSLLHQLDEQSQNYSTTLMPMLKNYISLRKKIASADPADTETSQEAAATASVFPPMLSSQPAKPMASMPVPIERTKKPETSREHLSYIAWLSEEILRASQEKVNLAQATYLAIREQEASLSNEGSIQLPDLTLPKSARDTKSECTNAIDSYNAIGAYANDTLNDHLDEEEDEPPLENQLTKSVAANLVINPKKVEGEEEELYCYCNRVSFGEMIACDNPQCNLEWFHLGCVGLAESPDGEWYCENCTKFDA
ncbi:hypothetical protein EST38_g12828 [Candolleomyces aberdarensis]|uniref:Chromatin modification-related protein n=1 Tax=Candolleomyces aberdarensis TaxID=2316362 RepID=A0A4Q2D4F4_9AGAR|nr:hypothetical protein EST38_g12828 [Candolleomyces aberdarensis]